MTTEERFDCTPGGAIAAGRRRLQRLFLAAVLVMLGFSFFAWFRGEVVPGLLGLAVALLVWTASRMSGELDPVRLRLTEAELALDLRRRRIEVPVAGATARLLTDEERRHLEGLASVGMVVASTGGFDSGAAQAPSRRPGRSGTP